VKVLPTAIPEVVVIEPIVREDARGFFLETWHAARYADAGLPATFVQDNHSGSARGVLRGLHYQLTRPQGKLVRVVHGAVFDVAVDLRRSSPTFGRWVGVELTAEGHRQLWIPPGFAHGFYTTSERADLTYKCTEYYAAGDERTLRWDDPDLAIGWPLDPARPPILSPKDLAGLPLADAELYP
jgi:dTDP-4-dehydrorhamnose 3,5-epimerase